MSSGAEILQALNNVTVGPLHRVLTRLEQIQKQLGDLGQDELAGKLAEARRALMSGDEPLFQKRVAFVQSKLGHLR